MAAKIERIISPSKTMRGMKKGQFLTISTRQIKAQTARTIANRLKNEGFEFQISDAGLATEVLIECIKSPNF